MAGGGLRRRHARRGRGAVQHLVETSAEDSSYLIADAGLDLLVAVGAFGGQDFAAALAAFDQPLPPVVILDAEPHSGWTAYAADLAGDPPSDIAAHPYDDALILYTSGSSARFKSRRLRLRQGRTVENGFRHRRAHGPWPH